MVTRVDALATGHGRAVVPERAGQGRVPSLSVPLSHIGHPAQARHRVGQDSAMTDSVAGPSGGMTGEGAEAGDSQRTAAMAPTVPFGEWESPITAADVAGGELWWQEGRPDEAGRVTVMHRSAGGRLTSLLPAPWNARTRVHEYGGRSFLPVPRSATRSASAGGRGPRGRAIVFASFADQRLYVAGPEVAEGS